MNNQPTLDMLTTGQTITGNVLSTATTTATGGTVLIIGLPLKPYFNYLRNILAKEIVDLKLRDRPIKTSDGKKQKMSDKQRYILEKSLELTAKRYAGVSTKNINTWVREFKRCGKVKRGPQPVISLERQSGSLDYVQQRHLNNNALRLDQLNGVLFGAMVKTAEDRGEPPPVSTAHVAASTMQTYINILCPFCIET